MVRWSYSRLIGKIHALEEELDSKNFGLVFIGDLKIRTGEESVRIETQAWQSGVGEIPADLLLTVQEKILLAVGAISQQKDSIEETNEEVRTKGKIRIFAGSPPICWNPESTIITKI